MLLEYNRDGATYTTSLEIIAMPTPLAPAQQRIFPLSAMVASTILGLISGASFHFSSPERAWDHLIAACLWVLMITTGTGLARSFLARLRPGEWRRGWRIGLEMAFPAMTCFVVALALVSAQARVTQVLASGAVVAGRPDVLALLPLFYGLALLPAVLVGPLFVLTSPYHHAHTHTSHPGE